MIGILEILKTLFIYFGRIKSWDSHSNHYVCHYQRPPQL